MRIFTESLFVESLLKNNYTQKKWGIKKLYINK